MDKLSNAVFAWGRWLLTGGCLFFGVGITALYWFQEKLLYVPRIPGMPDEIDGLVPERYGLDAEDVWLEASDGVKLHAWLLRMHDWTPEQVKTRPIIMYFQENAGPMLHRLPFLAMISRYLQCPVFALSYRGYGRSEGSPNQEGIMRDAQAALDHLLTRTDIDRNKIVVFGRSLGGAVAVYLTSANPGKIKGLVLENTFTSVEDMVGQMLPPLRFMFGPGRPGNILVTNKWRSIDLIADVGDIPLLMLTSIQDEMVPAALMRRLHKAQRSTKCTWVEFPRARHMDAYDVDRVLYWSSWREFFRQYLAA